MSIRLNKVAKDFNVGVSTLAEFLQKKNHEVQNNPNAKISDQEYGILEKEFGGGKSATTSPGHVKKEIKENAQESTKIEKKVEKKEPKKDDIFETEIEKKSVKLKQVGKIDLNKKPDMAKIKKDKPSHEQKAQEQMQKKEPKEPKKVENLSSVESNKPSIKKEQKETQKTEVKPEATTKKKEPEIFTFGSRKIESNLVVKGKIDLSSINQSTRPKKKSATEKRKEREAKLKKEREAKNKARAGSNTTAGGGTSDPKKKKRRTRIKDGKVKVSDISNNRGPKTNTNTGGNNNTPTNRRNTSSNRSNNSRYKKNNRFSKPEVSDVDVSKQIKETLARLTSKPKKGNRYRKEKRDAVNKKIKAEANREQKEKQIIKITEFVTVNELATMMNVPVVNVIQVCMNLGQMVSINQRLDAETINFVADEFGFETEYVSADVLSQIAEEEVEDTAENLEPRAPVVTVMGHVDHGKTSLLDYIRKENVIAGESGGITQHIGAYNVKLASGKKITFLDTPGHEAFTAMRARGAQVTDVAIIIIAADDDVMPQTIEAINHAKAAGVPIVFAINKIDKPGANPDRIKESLSKMNYLVEEWGGKYQSQDVSVKKGINVKELLEKVLLEAEMLDLKANPNRNATGSIIESTLDKGRGYTATILVQNGTLKVGDYMIAGTSHGRIKAMFNERGKKIKSAAPAEPAVILGLNGAPQAGDNFNILDSEQEAKDIANQREQLQREQGLRTSKTLTLAEIGRRIALGDFKELNLIVKGDVDGSIEALSDSLIKLSTEVIQVNVIHKAVGAISESDVTLAAASDATIVGFQVRPSGAAKKLADKEGVDIQIYSVIYDAIEEIKSAMEGMLSPKIKEEITATIDVREVYKITKVGTVAGCMVKEGKVYRGDKLRLIRDGIVKYEGEMGALKRFKDDVKDVSAGFECGLSFKTYQDLKVGDVVESYKEVEVKQKL